MSTPSRVFVGRLTSLSVFDPLGDQVGRVRDVVVTFGASRRRPRVIGLVVEVPGRRRVFVPMTRVTSVDGGQVITTGLVNMRRFEQRTNEVLVMAEIFERPVTVHDPEGDYQATVEDVAIERERSRDWAISKVFVRRGTVHAGALPAPSRRDGARAGRGRHRHPPVGAGAVRRDAARDLRRPQVRRPRRGDPRPAAQAPGRGGRGDGRRQARRRPRGAPRGRPGRDPRDPADRARRRRPRGHGARRRHRPAPQPHGGEAGGAAAAHGAGRGRRPAPAADLRRGVGRRHDDHRAGHPRPGGVHRRGARRRPPRRALPGAGVDDLRLPRPARDAHRPLPRHGPHPAAAARATARRHRRRSSTRRSSR